MGSCLRYRKLTCPTLSSRRSSRSQPSSEVITIASIVRHSRLPLSHNRTAFSSADSGGIWPFIIFTGKFSFLNLGVCPLFQCAPGSCEWKRSGCGSQASRMVNGAVRGWMLSSTVPA
ncbi:hypothetical protein M404DRAFT_513362 [Pisolithus tinctorius Marx 270]|uniref:Uncharacterized protein n=1 Tax=Pisolithus tinctorius Marx 270 TaxID=870435 RepID=A0A0C3NXU0_PISTI|nr:hypothetical protein M404DRAFT_513362 [Pisolithus tinctorius Marx 270]